MAQIVPETRETLESAGWQFTDKESIYAGCAAISKDEAGNYVWDLNAFFNALDGSSSIAIPQTKRGSHAQIIEKGLLTQEFLDNFDVSVSGLIIKVDIAGAPNRIIGTGVVRMLQQLQGKPLWRYVCGTAETDINISIDYNQAAGISVSTVRVYSYKPFDISFIYDVCRGVKYFGSRPALVLPDSVSLTGHSELTLTYADRQFMTEFGVTEDFIEAFATDPDLCLASVKPFSYNGYEGENKRVFVATELEDTLQPRNVLFRVQVMRFVLLNQRFDSDTDSWVNTYDKIELTREAPVVSDPTPAEWTLRVIV